MKNLFYLLFLSIVIITSNGDRLTSGLGGLIWSLY